ncbi:MAG TPA: M48 family metalloprotease, partial [Salinisphaeraceae bacterium]|nr:M48 family metalloprotease [Salinisphaeraceae bacterium]
FGRWIKAAVSRQREFLADASAVQFTRQSAGIAGALKKIAVYSDGSLLQTHCEEVNHMLFGEGTVRSLFATHPPLIERIRAIEPDFQEQELETLAAQLQRSAQRGEPPRAANDRPQTGGAAVFDADALIDRIGRVDGQTLTVAATVADSLPAALLQAARKVNSAPYLVLLLLLDSDDNVRGQQLQIIKRHLGGDGEQRLLDLMAQHGPPQAAHRLPLLNAALPGLKRRSGQQLAGFVDLVDELSAADHRISAFEFLLMQVLRVYLRDAEQAPKPGGVRLSRSQDAAAATLAALAHFGNAGDRSAAQVAYTAGAEALQLDRAAPWPDTPTWPAALRQSLERLDRLAARDKRQLVQAWIATALQDQTVVTAELELLRAFCVAVHVPMPPLRQDSASQA